MEIDDMIAVLQAAKSGKPIQGSRVGQNDFGSAYAPTWDFSRYEYRVKREPREFWVAGSPNQRALFIFNSLDDAAGWERNELFLVREVLDENKES